VRITRRQCPTGALATLVACSEGWTALGLARQSSSITLYPGSWAELHRPTGEEARDDDR
jgi:hypothetical protein